MREVHQSAACAVMLFFLPIRHLQGSSKLVTNRFLPPFF